MSNEFELVMTIVDRGVADDLMAAAKAAGATGGTILHGRGTGGKDAVHFYGITVKEEKELLLIVCKKEIKNDIMKAVTVAGKLHERGAGITFSLPVTQIVGINKRNPDEKEAAPAAVAEETPQEESKE